MNKLIKWFKQLVCEHDYSKKDQSRFYTRACSFGEFNTVGRGKHYMKCIKCGKIVGVRL